MNNQKVVDNTMKIWAPTKGVLALMKVKRPKLPPRGCKMVNQDLECTECGVKANCVKRGHCFFVEGNGAMKN